MRDQRLYLLAMTYDKFTEQAAVYFRQISVSAPAVHTQPPLWLTRHAFYISESKKKASTRLADAT